jgi:predicted RNA-binding Zn ribbon-like protein
MVTSSGPAAAYHWDFCGGQPALDFTNTVSERGGTAIERLTTYADLLSWARGRKLLTAGAVAALTREAEARPDAARDALESARTLREALYRTIRAAAVRRAPNDADLDLVTAHLRASYAQARLGARRGRFAIDCSAPDRRSLLAPIATPVVLAAVALLTSSIERVRVCAEPSCAWLFLDRTRAGTRRWCDMKVCGNRSKVRRFRRRRRTS